MRLFLFSLLPALCWGASEFATVEVMRMSQRSADSPDSSSYRLHINGLEEQERLSVRSPSYSIFTPDFQYLEATSDPVTGEPQVNDATPSKRELAHIESNFFTDPESNVAVSLKRSADGSFQVSGRIDDKSIVHRENNIHEIVRQVAEPSTIRDYIDVKRAIKGLKVTKSTTRAQPEIFVVWDYEFCQQFNFNRNQILDYTGVFFHAVNNRFATARDPIISFRISGVLAINSRNAQPYMENNRVSGGYDINKVLDDFAKWLYSNGRQTPRFDAAALISNSDMKSKDSNGAYSSGVAGLAYLGTVCLNSTYWRQHLGSSVNEDQGGYYNGIFTVAHELAHNLGSPHDGEGDASNCPWSEGYIMSYEGWGTKNKFYFSPCSLNLMKNVINSDNGKCTRSQESSSSVPISNDNTGDRYSMEALCKKTTGSQDAVPDPNTSADDQCKMLKCRYPHPDKPGWYRISWTMPPGDNAPCGNGGRCIDGDCVVRSG